MRTPGSKTAATLGFAAVVVALAFAAWTRHAWEDYLITFRASLNLATGNGLVFTPGERVHSFTSPLGTLLPALFALGGGDGVEWRALWGLRFVSALALGAAVYGCSRQALRDKVAPACVAMVGALFVCDPKIVDFSINGMESGILVFFVTFTWLAFARSARPTIVGLGFAGLQWTRPDGFVFFGALALAWLALSNDGTVRSRFIHLVKAVAIGVAVYVPWVIFAAWYYGSPIPHTILAKHGGAPLGATILNLVQYPVRLLTGSAEACRVFMPAYHELGGWPAGLIWYSRILGWGAAAAWAWPGVGRPGRMASAAFFLGGFYLEYIPRAPWYFPVWQALALVSWFYLLDALGSVRALRFRAISLPRAIGLALVSIQVGLFVAAAFQMRTQQQVIETGHRREIGRWLREQAAPGDRVFLEPLGYIGYYSQLKTLDYPGLASREVVATRRAGNVGFDAAIAALKPEWVVLRPHEIGHMRRGGGTTLETSYEAVRAFDARPNVDAIAILPGRGYLAFDSVFYVYRRRERAEASAGP